MKKWIAVLSIAVSLVPARAQTSADSPDIPPQILRRDPSFSESQGEPTGDIELGLVVDAWGNVSYVQVLSGVTPYWEDPAIISLFKWNFTPAIKNGRAIATVAKVAMNFSGDSPDLYTVIWMVPKKPPAAAPPEFRYDIPPRRLLLVQAVYPYDLLLRGIKGSATVAYEVDPTGQPRKIKVVTASHPEFGAATVAMISAMKYRPALNKGRPCWSTGSHIQIFKRWDWLVQFSSGTVDVLADMKKKPCPVLDGAKDLDEKLIPIYYPQVVVPEDVVLAHIPAQATIRIIVDRQGRAQLPRILSATRDDFGWAAATAVGRWLFYPPKKDGSTAEAVVDIPISYSPTNHTSTMQTATASVSLVNEEARNISVEDPFVATVGPSSLVEPNEASVPPTPKLRVLPVYPLQMRIGGVTGQVVLDFTIKRDGTTSDARVAQATSPAFAQAALQALAEWKFYPGMLHERPVTCSVEMPFIFKAKN